MTELSNKYSKRGLVVLGVTEEDAKTVKPYLDKHGITYPIVIEKAGKSARELGVSGIPRAFLVDPRGKVTWSGHPSRLDDTELEKALTGARPASSPLVGALAPAGKLLDKEEYGKAYGALQALLDAGTLQGEPQQTAEELRARILGQARSLYTEAEAHVVNQEYLQAVRKFERVGIQYAGVPETDQALAKVNELRADSAIVKQIAGGEKLEKAQALEQAKDYGKARDLYLALVRDKDLAGSKVGEAAKAAVEQIRNKGWLGFDKKCERCAEFETACPKHKKKG